MVVHRPDLNASLAHATLEEAGTQVRLGLAGVRSLGDEAAQRIVDERTAHGRFADLDDAAARVELSHTQWEALATAGALDAFGLTRRQALWAAERRRGIVAISCRCAPVRRHRNCRVSPR